MLDFNIGSYSMVFLGLASLLLNLMIRNSQTPNPKY